MKKGKLKKQKYTLVSVTKLGLANCTPLICEDCGATIFNFAIIKDMDNNKYTVGLTCLKKLLKYGTILFEETDILKSKEMEKDYDKAINLRKYIDNYKKRNENNGVKIKWHKNILKNGMFNISSEILYLNSKKWSNSLFSVPIKKETDPIFSDLNFN